MQQIQEMKKNCLNVVILGEAGVGKSTFINAFANYLQSQSLQEMIDQPNKVISVMATECTLTDPSTGQLKTCSLGKKSTEEELAVKNPGASFTQSCTTYSFSVNSVTIRIVDTPGLVDSRGTEQDNININNIMSYLQHFEKVHAFLFLFKANTERLQPAFQYCFKAFLNKLHKDAARNIIFVNTNSRTSLYNPAGTAALLDTMLEEVRKENKIELYRHYGLPDSPDTNDFISTVKRFAFWLRSRMGFISELKRLRNFQLVGIIYLRLAISSCCLLDKVYSHRSDYVQRFGETHD